MYWRLFWQSEGETEARGTIHRCFVIIMQGVSENVVQDGCTGSWSHQILPQCRHTAILKWRLLERGSDHVTTRSAYFELKNPCWGAVTYLFEDNCSSSLALSPFWINCSVAILNQPVWPSTFYWEVGEQIEYVAWRTNTLAKVFAWLDDGKVHEEKINSLYSKCFILSALFCSVKIVSDSAFLKLV